MKGEKQRGLEEMSALRTDKLQENADKYNFFFFAFLAIKVSRDLDSARLFLSDHQVITLTDTKEQFNFS